MVGEPRKKTVTDPLKFRCVRNGFFARLYIFFDNRLAISAISPME